MEGRYPYTVTLTKDRNFFSFHYNSIYSISTPSIEETNKKNFFLDYHQNEKFHQQRHIREKTARSFIFSNVQDKFLFIIVLNCIFSLIFLCFRIYCCLQLKLLLVDSFFFFFFLLKPNNIRCHSLSLLHIFQVLFRSKNNFLN